MARSNEGFVLRTAAWGGALGRAAPLITLALKRTWIEGFNLLAAQTPTLLGRVFGLNRRGKIVLAIFSDICAFPYEAGLNSAVSRRGLKCSLRINALAVVRASPSEVHLVDCGHKLVLYPLHLPYQR